MKKKILIFIPIIILGIVGIYILTSFNYTKELTIKIGEAIPTLNDFTKKAKGSISWSNNVDNYINGTYTGTFLYNNKKYSVKLNVVDDEAPTITDEVTVNQYDKVEIPVTDNSHDNLDISTDIELDTFKVGTFSVNVTAIDANNNKATKEVKVKVISEAEKNGKNIETVETTSKGYLVQKIDNLYYVNGLLIANKTYALPSSYNPGGLLELFNSNFNDLKSAAKKEGVNLSVISGYRSYATQQGTYNNWVSYYGKTKADTLSARPGHSEHQTGLAADINSLSQSFINTKEGKWLNDNCYRYGFIIRYVKDKDDQTGYMYEPWHIRYVGKDLAKKLYNNGDWLTVEEYFGITSKY
ncbi:MAG: D-alanyl-D-alanine carboxypeptidase family protein [Bacilli bacterium]|nr:D-alanyl-D-alanine carboxypeptidase family protein [Bacilli bacterium]